MRRILASISLIWLSLVLVAPSAVAQEGSSELLQQLPGLQNAWGPSHDTIASVRAVGEFMVAAEPGTGEKVFDEFGESSGGVFDLFPRSEDSNVLQGLIPMYEYNLLISDHPLEYPATPAARVSYLG